MGLRALIGTAVWGGTTAIVAYLLSFGDLIAFFGIMVVFGALLRMAAYRVVKRRSGTLPRGWWI